jgi:hypothetical protein
MPAAQIALGTRLLTAGRALYCAFCCCCGSALLAFLLNDLHDLVGFNLCIVVGYYG